MAAGRLRLLRIAISAIERHHLCLDRHSIGGMQRSALDDLGIHTAVNMAKASPQGLDQIHVAASASRIDAGCGTTVDPFEHFEACIANAQLLADEREFLPRL